MKNKGISLRLIIMNFLQYAIWGAYLISMGSFLGKAGYSITQISLFYAIQGIVSIFMPALMGIVADKWIPAQKTLSLCQGIAGASMLAMGIYAMSPEFNKSVFMAFYIIGSAFYMPTIAISNSVAYNALERFGKDPVSSFPPIRVFGTVGFICSMLFVNFMVDPDGIQYQHSNYQFLTSGVLGLLLCIYSLTLPECPCKPKSAERQSFAEMTGLSAFKLFKDRNFAVFFIFSMLLGGSLQITNAYGNSFITSFQDIPQYAEAWGAKNANALISLSQLSETLCILLIPFFMKRFGIKNVMLIAMFAWVIRFGFFGLGNPGSGVWLFIISCIVYGVAFDFFNISGSLYVNEHTDKSIRSSAQGLFMLMTNGLGASIGTLAAGQVVKHFVETSSPDWPTAWYIFAAYALVVAVLFAILFKDPEKHGRKA